MKRAFKQIYPMPNHDDDYRPEVDVVNASLTAQVVDLASLGDIVYITMTNATASAVTVNNPKPGQKIIIEQDSTGVNNHAVTFTGVTINAAGNNVATTNADDESLILIVATATRLVIVANNGAVALS